MGASKAVLIFITIQLFSIATAQEMVKRMPQGFLGMRGKKYYDDLSTEQFYKRKPQFFVGVKGKKSLQDLLESPEEYYKRAPMGFMGMRGKKDSKQLPDILNDDFAPKIDGSLIGQIDYTSGESKLNSDFPILNHLLMEYVHRFGSPMESNSNEIDNDLDVEKRAGLNQFFGVRGKKSVTEKRPYDLSFRGKFIGVRGKKDLKNQEQEIKFFVDQNGPLPKRKSQMGFFGMRGKKWTDESSPEMETPN